MSTYLDLLQYVQSFHLVRNTTPYKINFQDFTYDARNDTTHIGLIYNPESNCSSYKLTFYVIDNGTLVEDDTTEPLFKNSSTIVLDHQSINRYFKVQAIDDHRLECSDMSQSHVYRVAHEGI